MLAKKLRTFVSNPYGAMRHRLSVGAMETRRAIAAHGLRINDKPILVIGNQKSGTTAIAALLGEATDTSTALDFVHFNNNNPVYKAVMDGQVTMRRFIQMNRLEFSKSIIKEPHLTFFAPHLRKLFPDARFVFIMRDPRDNIRSILDRFEFPGNCEELSETMRRRILRSWRLVYEVAWLNLPGGTYIEKLAQRWLAAAQICTTMPADTIVLRYEDFKQSKLETVHSLAEQLMLPVRRDIRDRLDVQYQPAGNNQVTWHGFFGQKNLERINTICKPMMNHFGYPLG